MAGVSNGLQAAARLPPAAGGSYRLRTSQGATFTPLLPRAGNASSGATAGRVLCLGKEGKEAWSGPGGSCIVPAGARAWQVGSEHCRPVEWAGLGTPGLNQGTPRGATRLLCDVAQQHVLAHQLAVHCRAAQWRGKGSAFSGLTTSRLQLPLAPDAAPPPSGMPKQPQPACLWVLREARFCTMERVCGPLGVSGSTAVLVEAVATSGGMAASMAPACASFAAPSPCMGRVRARRGCGMCIHWQNDECAQGHAVTTGWQYSCSCTFCSTSPSLAGGGHSAASGAEAG